MSAGETCACANATWDGVWLNEEKWCKGEKKLKLAEAKVGKKTLGGVHHWCLDKTSKCDI